MVEKAKGISEDWLALWLGLFIFILSLGVFGGTDILGWGINTSVWMDPAKAMSPVSKAFQPLKGEITKIDGQKLTLKKADGKEETITVPESTAALKTGEKYERAGLSGIMSLFLTYLAMLAIMTVGAILLKTDVIKFAIGFTVIFWISYACWFFGHFAYIAATKNQFGTFKIPWSLSLTGESGFIIALIAGLVVGNFFPGISEKLKEASRPELYIKTAIVIMGAALGLKAAQSFTLASNIMFRGMCAIVEAYLIYWAVVYYMARKYFKFSKEWAAPLASGISICGVSAAIATGGAIRARPVVPIMVSSLVVIFAVVEMIILPFAAQTFLWKEPLVAGAWMGLAVKTDGGAVASGAITDALIRAKALEASGVAYQEGWITMTATTVKMFIDIFIGVWAFVLAWLWCAKIECKPGEKVSAAEIWYRFPKFVIGYVLTFFILLVICWPASTAINPVEKDIKSTQQEITAAEKQIATVQTAQMALQAKITTATDRMKAVKAENKKIKANSPADKELKALKQEIAEAEKQLAAAKAAQPDQDAIKAKIAAGKDKIKGLNDQIKAPKKTMAAAGTSSNSSNVFRVMFFVFTFFTIGIVSNFKKLWEEGIGRLMVVYVVALFGFIIWIGLFISWLFFHGVKPPLVG